MIKHVSCSGEQDGVLIIDNLVVPVLPANIYIVNTTTGDAVTDQPHITPPGANVTISGNTITVDKNGKYGWENLAAGRYTITIEDSSQPVGCNRTLEVVIEEPDNITFDYVVTPDGCTSERVNLEVVAEGGTPKYRYVVSNDALGVAEIEKSNGVFKGLPSSDEEPYLVKVVDANGCEYEREVILRGSGGLRVDVGKKDVGCNGACDGQISVVATGGKPPYQFIVRSEPPGDYVYSSTCEEDRGDACYTFSGLCAGEYSIEVIDSSGCSLIYKDEDENEVIEIQEPPAIVITNPTVNHVTCNSCCDGSIVIDSITGGVGPYILEITSGPEGAILPSTVFTDGATPTTIRNLSPGNYTLRVTDSTGCYRELRFGINAPSQINVSV